MNKINIVGQYNQSELKRIIREQYDGWDNQDAEIHIKNRR